MERRPVRLEDAEALKAFFLREPVKAYLLGHYKQKMLLEVGVGGCGILDLGLLGRRIRIPSFSLNPPSTHPQHPPPNSPRRTRAPSPSSSTRSGSR